jgi:hypothetical protein
LRTARTSPASPCTNTCGVPDGNARSATAPQGVGIPGVVLAVHPHHVERNRGAEIELAVGPVHDRHDDGAPSGRHAFERRADGGERGLVADEQAPVGVGAGRVATARTGHLQAITLPGVPGPATGVSLVAVGHDVDGQLACTPVPVPHGLPPTAGSEIAGPGAHDVEVERDPVRRTLGREQRVDVPVGERRRGERPQPVAAEDQPHHAPRDLLGAEHRPVQGVHDGPRRSCLSAGHHVAGASAAVRSSTRRMRPSMPG